MRCDLCERESVIDQPYRQAHLCGPHFDRSIVERVRAEFHRQLPGFSGGTVAVALSGGKDSTVALALSRAYFGRRPTVRLVALTVDEGIAGYRDASIRAAERACAALDIEHRVLRAEDELGWSTDRAARQLTSTIPCSFCGVWRRSLLNRGARELGADALVLGFNLDDLAQTVLMNVIQGDLDRLVRMAPHRRRRPGLIPRLAPLAEIPEREVFLYARRQGLPFDHRECPYAARAARNLYRSIVWTLEESRPGTRQSLLKIQRRLADRLGDLAPGPSAVCDNCGEPAAGPLCRSCAYLRIAEAPPREVPA